MYLGLTDYLKLMTQQGPHSGANILPYSVAIVSNASSKDSILWKFFHPCGCVSWCYHYEGLV